MAATVAVVVAILLVGTALGLVRQTRRRIAVLEHELDDVYQAQQILDRARTRKDRKHLHLLGLIPVAWLFRSSHARLAAATGISAAIVGVGFTAPDNPVDPPLRAIPPAAAEPLDNTPAPVDTPVRAHGTLPALQYPSTTTTVSAEVLLPPAASADVEGEPVPSAPSAAPAPSTTTTTVTATVEVEVPRVCLTPAITILDTCSG